MRQGIIIILWSFWCSLLHAQQDMIPMPEQLVWGEGELDLSRGVVLENRGDIESNDLLLEILSEWGVHIEERDSKNTLPFIRIEQVPGKSNDQQDESYRLNVTREGIQVSAYTDAGIFYALQSLRQFTVNNQKIPCVSIEDRPAFPWRAFLLDVGRNYQPLALLKEQIDVMAKYKFNVLHFHFTEDIAWRLISKRYPGLTDSANMTRWAGKYYTEEEFKELIAYCEARHIRLLPEIDMPGHSAAFKRFFGVDMQSDSGIFYIKALLREFRYTYPELDILHIGGDEVKIVNKNFMPEITRYVEELGYKKTVGWEPGSNLLPQTLRQLWMGGPQPIEEKGNVVYIDSRHLYINHMDPLETVTTLFHRKIGEQDQGHNNLIGATLCSWPDRAVSKPLDMLYQSAVYPAMLAFAERIWKGGGRSDWVCNVLPEQTLDYMLFRDFEKRLLMHKARYFTSKPFPYTKQTGLKWDLIGPFDNAGDLNMSFIVEKGPFRKNVAVYKEIEGGTVVLRHWWSDIIQGAIDNPQMNTTWYARTKIWSDKMEDKSFWIGFNDLSRSYASDSPHLGTWDDRHSKVWVNGQLVRPPEWKQPGLKGNLEKPMLDEGYAFREPTMIPLKEGWNEVLVKLPVSSFKAKDWQNPVKWMFTFAPINE